MKTSFSNTLDEHKYLIVAIVFVVIVLGMLSTTPAFGEQPNTNNPYAKWVISYDEAVNQSKQTGLPIMLVFSGSDWCGWCKKLSDDVFNTHEFARWSTDNVIKVEVDFPKKRQLPSELSRQNQRLKNLFGDQVQIYPTILFVDAEGNVLGKTGFVEGGPQNWIHQAQKIVKPRPHVDLIARVRNTVR